MSNNTTLSQNYQTVQAKIRTATAKAGRIPTSVHLIAVSKTFPSEAIAELYTLGQKSFGESYVQEWQKKILSLAQLDIEWHFIGPLQANKTKTISEYATWVHSLDRLKIAERLSAQRPPHMPPLNICIQINISEEDNKNGVTTQAMIPLAQSIKALPNIRLRGIMCIPEATQDTIHLTKQFLQMQALFKQLQAAGFPVDTLSMGMSADMSLAIEHGATHIRIGRALFGQRNYPQT